MKLYFGGGNCGRSGEGVSGRHRLVTKILIVPPEPPLPGDHVGTTFTLLIVGQRVLDAEPSRRLSAIQQNVLQDRPPPITTDQRLPLQQYDCFVLLLFHTTFCAASWCSVSCSVISSSGLCCFNYSLKTRWIVPQAQMLASHVQKKRLYESCSLWKKRRNDTRFVSASKTHFVDLINQSAVAEKNSCRKEQCLDVFR